MVDDAWNGLPVTLTSADLQTLLNVGTATVSKWLKEGRVPSHRIGNTWITFRCDVTAWLHSTTNTPVDARPDDPHPLDSYGPLLTKTDLEALFRKGRPVISGWLRDGTIPAYQVGNQRLVENKVLRQVLDATANNTSSET